MASPNTLCKQVNSLGTAGGVISRIQHLNITKSITYRNPKAAGYGGFSEVFRGRFQDGESDVDVAIKRLRFYLDEANITKAGQPVLSSVVPVSS